MGKDKDNLVYGGYELNPLVDITTYELAVIMGITTLQPVSQEEAVMKLPDNCLRHLIRFDLDIETGKRVYENE